MTQIFTIIAAIIIFAVLIFVHEFGHFITAKISGVRVLEFALGMGPKIFSFKKGETLYSLRTIPIGGYCAMEGEDGGSDDPKAFSNKSAPKRLLVLVAGALMNILLGFVLLCILFSNQPGYVSNKVASVEAESAAQSGGLAAGDEIIEINGSRIHLGIDVQYAAQTAKREENEFVVKRGDEKISLLIKKEAGEPYGITLQLAENSAFNVLKQAYFQTFFYSRVILNSLVDLLRGNVSVSDMSGPIGIVSEIGSAVQEGIETGASGVMRLLSLTILLTINLGIFNLLPIPALDGGRILFVLVQLILRKRLPPEKEGMVHMIGFVALMLFALFVAYMDVLKIVR